MQPLPLDDHHDIATTAARLVVEEGLEYGPAKRRAVKLLGYPARAALPANDIIEDAVHAYIALFCADTQPGELAALRELALRWMERMSAFRPHLGGSVWHGTATRRSDLHLDLFCEDSKSAEMVLIDHRADYETRTATGLRGEPVDVLSVHDLCQGLNEMVGVHLMVYDLDDLRGALKPDAKGRVPRGNQEAVRRRINSSVHTP
ncbi:MAG: hypothetical protein KA164_17000 [Rhodoferax sp.]|jgi:hypothetical protein|nr:hypothetical protein [Rhodoferax sp.]